MDTLQELKLKFHQNEGRSHELPSNSQFEVTELRRATIQEVEREALKYHIKQWLGDHKENVVVTWIDRSFHAGMRTTLQSERGHSRLKVWIRGSSGHLLSVFSAFRTAIPSEITQISLNVAQQYATSVTDCCLVYLEPELSDSPQASFIIWQRIIWLLM